MPKAATAKPTKIVNKKDKKDPNKPKRGRSAYMFFAQENRERIQKENPKATFGQIGKLMGEEWQKLSDKEKKPYNDKATADKERYEKEKADYESK